MLPSRTATRKALAFLAEVRHLVLPYWQSEERWIAGGLLAVVVGLTLGLVGLLVLLNNWNRDFYNALEQRDFGAFQGLLLQFCLLAGLYIVGSVYRMYLRQVLQIRWRTWLTNRYVAGWLAGQAYYHMELRHRGADNPDQRIADDLNLFTTDTLRLALDALSSTVTVGSFVAVLWGISGPLDFTLGAFNLSIPGYMVWVAVVYALIGSWLTHWVGRRLVSLNFQQQRLEADFRFSLARLREHAESVALYRGEAAEQERLRARFQGVRGNWWALMDATKRLTFLTVGYAQVAVVFPFIVAAPRYFAGVITLGVLMQISSAFGQVQNSLSWFVDNYSDLAVWKATADRLLSFQAATAEVMRQPLSADSVVVARGPETALHADHLHLDRPDGPPLLADLQLTIDPGDYLVIAGPSGSGKSTLLRAIAGIWPYGRGQVRIPADGRVMFLPQKPYIPLATLREAVSYPAPGGAFDDATIRETLRATHLGRWCDRLDESHNWSMLLSGGEQQRLAIARALLHRPDWLFLDEATAALDAPSRRALLELLQRRLPACTVVSVTHHPEQVAAARRTLLLTPRDGGATTCTVSPVEPAELRRRPAAAG